jgi:hypothetical protein
MADTVKLASKGVLLAKIETTYGTDPTPTGGANAIRVEEPKVEPSWKKLTRNYAQSYMGAKRQIVIGETVKISFKTEIKGSGSAGTAPEIGPLLRACGRTETIVPATSVAYAPNSLVDSGESITIYVYKDGIARKVLGCRGNAVIEAKAGEFGYISWEFEGLYAGPVDEANASPTWTSVLPPRFISASFTYASMSAIISSLKIDFGNELAKRPSANAATGMLQVFIKDRKVTASIDPEVVALATKNWETAMTGNTEAALAATLGSSAGNICTIGAPKVVIDDLKEAEREGIWTYDMPLVCLPNSGNDELTLTFT